MTHPAGPEPTTPEAPAAPGPLGMENRPKALSPGIPTTHRLCTCFLASCFPPLRPPPSPPHTLLVSAARLGSFLHRVQRRPLWRMAQTPPHPDPPPPCLPAPGWVSLFAECLPTRKGKPTHRSCTPVPAKRHST